MRSKKWHFKLFYHLVDVAAVNAWLLYRRALGEATELRLASFRAEVSETLMRMGELNTVK